MEKVTNLAIRLPVFIFIIVSSSCNPTKQEATLASDGAAVQTDTTVTADTSSGQQYAPVSEIFEYRSESLRNYELYAVYPYQDAPQFIAVRNGEARLLKLEEDREVEEGQALEDDEFVAANFLEEAEAEGITTYGQIELTTRADVTVVFNHSYTKRSLIIGEQYSFTSENGSGNFALTPQGDQYTVSIQTNSGAHVCELSGPVSVKGNVAYFQGNELTNCKLFFFFTDRKVQVLQISSNTDCDCGANASLNHQFALK